jgi:hypothetical protein
MCVGLFLFQFSNAYFQFQDNSLECVKKWASEEKPHPNIFIDEFPSGEDGFTSEEVAEISQNLSSRSFLWIACRSEGDNPYSEFDSGKIEYFNFNIYSFEDPRFESCQGVFIPCSAFVKT